MLPFNYEDRRVHDTESSPDIQMLDQNIVQKSNSLTETSEVKAQNVTLLREENMIPSMASKELWETNSLLRDNEEGWHSSLQHRESLSSGPAMGKGNIIHGSDQRVYRIHKGPVGPIGPQGRRVSISLGGIH